MREYMSQAVLDVVTERHRQIQSEGWTPEHDNAHDKGEMAWAAVVYASNASPPGQGLGADRERIVRLFWPWDWSWWEPTSRRRDLVKAAALLLAEIERLDRAEEREHGQR